MEQQRPSSVAGGPAERERLLETVAGYLNFSSGRPDAQFQRSLSQFYAQARTERPWDELAREVLEAAPALAQRAPALGNLAQAEAVLRLAVHHVLPAYRDHHRDLLLQISDQELFQPFFLARLFEAVLAEGPPWEQTGRIVASVLRRLNDFVGHRPVAVLENERQMEPYDHERVRPVPLFIRGAGVAAGPYSQLISGALDILSRTDADLLAAAHFDLDQLDELAFDPRPYDFSHPVHQRPNYVFGEWDPHHLDGQGRYCRFIVRLVTLRALVDRLEGERELPASELAFEASAVLACTMLMSSAVSGSGPDTHDSTVTLETLLPGIAACRDTFYQRLLESLGGRHGQRLRREAEQLGQPFAAARQQFNRYLAQLGAAQQVHTRLAYLFARMGYAGAGRRQAAVIPTPSARILCEMYCRAIEAHQHLDAGQYRQAAACISGAVELLHRGIHCGAIADPWNILGFQGQFSLFPARQNSVPDSRVGVLLEVMQQLFSLYSRLLSEAACAGDEAAERQASADFERLATWWDRFATYEVDGLPAVFGQESFDTARRVAEALAVWRRSGEATGDVAFWRRYEDIFCSPQAYAQVLDTLLDKGDRVASFALLMHWLSRAEDIPLEDETGVFRTRMLRWMLETLGPPPDSSRTGSGGGPPPWWPSVQKCFDFLEANADQYWQVPRLAPADEDQQEELPAEPGQDLYAAAYEGVTFHDGAEDGEAGGTVANGEPWEPFPLEFEAEELIIHLGFLTTVAELWEAVSVALLRLPPCPETAAGIENWWQQATENERRLLELLHAIQNCPMPRPSGSPDSMLCHDTHLQLKQALLTNATHTMFKTMQARNLLGCLRRQLDVHPSEADQGLEGWRTDAAAIQQALWRADAETARTRLPALLTTLKQYPLTWVPIELGGNPREVVRTRLAYQVLIELARALPRAGLVSEAVEVVRTAAAMEERKPHSRQALTPFDGLFREGLVAVAEAALEAAAGEQVTDEFQLHQCLQSLIHPLAKVWGHHCMLARVSVLELMDQAEAEATRQFIRRYGRDLFTPRFLTVANLRALLDQGIEAWLDYMQQNRDPLRPVQLIEDLDRSITRNEVADRLRIIAQALIENHDIYIDYNSSTVQSDYGDRLYILFDFLDLRARYRRVQWHLAPLATMHAVVARYGRHEVARRWEQIVAENVSPYADMLMERMAELERRHGVQLQTIRQLLSGRFVRSMAVERMCALAEPAMGPDQQAADRAFERLRQLTADFCASWPGTGREPPPWLLRLEEVAEQVRDERAVLTRMLRRHFQAPRLVIPWQSVLQLAGLGQTEEEEGEQNWELP